MANPNRSVQSRDEETELAETVATTLEPSPACILLVSIPSWDIAAQYLPGSGQTAGIRIRIAIMHRFTAFGGTEIKVAV